MLSIFRRNKTVTINHRTAPKRGRKGEGGVEESHNARGTVAVTTTT